MKRRFGISIPEEVARDLDNLAEKLNTDRSKIVCEAVRLYIRDHIHYLFPHECRGVITLVSEDLNPLKVVEEYRDVIMEFSHIHVEKICINSLIVSGSSIRIAELHKRLLEICKDVRFIPLNCERCQSCSLKDTTAQL